jgi:hypothetical protein
MIEKQFTLGGVDRFWLIPESGLQMSDPINKTINRVIATGVFTLGLTKDSLQYQEDRKAKKQIKSNKSLTGFHPGDSVETRHALSQLTINKYYVLLKNRVQEKYLMSLHPCELTYEYNKGESLEDESGYQITLQTTQADTLHRVNYLSFQGYLIDSNLQALSDSNGNRLVSWKTS